MKDRDIIRSLRVELERDLQRMERTRNGQHEYDVAVENFYRDTLAMLTRPRFSDRVNLDSLCHWLHFEWSHSGDLGESERSFSMGSHEAAEGLIYFIERRRESPPNPEDLAVRDRYYKWQRRLHPPAPVLR
ncbi:MAG: hypothetical protein KGI98_14915 [Euryarchaeota archaeon]|nr:hypothetical protein [Euryarchaeota archaeon]MDE1879459.1 hypothetical protein [Euryarchaeota archaeon]